MFHTRRKANGRTPRACGAGMCGISHPNNMRTYDASERCCCHTDVRCPRPRVHTSTYTSEEEYELEARAATAVEVGIAKEREGRHGNEWDGETRHLRTRCPPHHMHHATATRHLRGGAGQAVMGHADGAATHIRAVHLCKETSQEWTGGGAPRVCVGVVVRIRCAMRGPCAAVERAHAHVPSMALWAASGVGKRRIPRPVDLSLPRTLKMLEYTGLYAANASFNSFQPTDQGSCIAQV